MNKCLIIYKQLLKILFTKNIIKRIDQVKDLINNFCIEKIL